MVVKKKIDVGDVFQILTSIGLCYGVVTHNHPKWKWVVAIFGEVHDQVLKDVSVLVEKNHKS